MAIILLLPSTSLVYTAILHVQIVRQISWRDVRVWLKEHDWKSCVRQKRTWGSNPHLSATYSAPRKRSFFVLLEKTLPNSLNALH